MIFNEKERKELQELSFSLLQHSEFGKVRKNQHRRLVMLGWPSKRKTEREYYPRNQEKKVFLEGRRN